MLAPLAAQAGKPAPGAFVPNELLAAATANPNGSYKVIVEGTNATKTAAVAGDVENERAATPGKAKGIGRRFRLVNGVSAELTGKQILKLATRKDILAIVSDASVRLSDAGAPVNAAPPIVSGTAQSGETLSATPGDWLGTPDGFSYQWERCALATLACEPITAATAPSYTIGDADVGATLRVDVTATNLAGTGSAESVSTDTVVGAAVSTPPPTVLAPPAISGSATENAMLTADPGSWDGAPLAYGYQWQRCDATGATCSDIAGATGAEYTATSLDVGSRLEVVVSASNDGGQASASSTASDIVAPDTSAAAPVNAGPPIVSGTAQSGETLSATPGDWLGTPDGFAYQWERCTLATLALTCEDITGATDSSYVATDDDVDATLRVAVTATNAAGTASAESDPTDTVSGAVAIMTTPEPSNVDPPAISGSATENATLTSDAGTWDGTPLLYAYQWQRCDAGGAACVDIAGATDAAYTATALDVGARVRVVVSASNAGGQASATSSASDVVAPDTSFSSGQQWPYASGVSTFWPDAAAGTQQTPTIAVVDSGIDASRADFGSRVLQQVTVTSSTSNSAGDGYGHGTFVASVAAGQAHGYTGAAPDANLVSLDVMDDNGMATLSDVIAAADWIYEHKAEYDIRVANFSLTGSVATSIQWDPLDQAVEKLWLSGVVVVAAAGNYAVDGAQSGVPYAPANDPFVISVGAEDLAANHVAAPWSSFGYTPDGFAKPELGAPGRYMIGAVPPGSTLATERPEQVVAPGYMELSGTSFAAPVIAGTAAELLAAHPSWTPDQVKGALMVAARPVAAAVPLSLGVGELDAAGARAVTDPPNPNAALDEFVVPDPAGSTDPVFDTAAWGQAVQGSAAWGQAAWGQAAWGQAAWGQAAWGQAYWSSAAWGQGAAMAAPDAAAIGSDAG